MSERIKAPHPLHKQINSKTIVADISEAEDYLLRAHRQLRQAQESPQEYHRWDFWQNLRAIADRIEAGEEIEREEPETVALARLIVQQLKAQWDKYQNKSGQFPWVPRKESE